MKKSIFIVVNEDASSGTSNCKQRKKFTNKFTRDERRVNSPIIKNYIIVPTNKIL